MKITYDMIYGSFLSKVSEYEFIQLPERDRTSMLDGYLARACSSFRKNCRYNLANRDEILHEFEDDFLDEDVDEILDILSEGMLIQWLKPYVYRQELLENALNTNDFSSYSPAELLKQVRSAYSNAQKDYTQMVREYSYNHGSIKELHL